MTQPNAPTLPDGLVVFLKRECETCRMVAPLLTEFPVVVFTQDDPAFPDGLPSVHDGNLSLSWHHDIETVPTLIRVADGVEVERTSALRAGIDEAVYPRASGCARQPVANDIGPPGPSPGWWVLPRAPYPHTPLPPRGLRDSLWAI